MAISATHWTVASNGDIRYTGPAHEVASASYATVIEFHRWLQDLADDASASGDDLMDITKSTPSDRSTDNIITLLTPYNIDQTAAEHLYDGSIIQTGGDDIWDGIVNFGTEGIEINVIQNGAVDVNPFWNSTPDGEASKGLNRNVAGGISHRWMQKTRTAGTDIDGRRLVANAREFGFTYSEFSINGTSRGNNVFALSQSTDLNNGTVAGTVAGWSTITNTEGYRALDINGNAADEYYYSEWTKAAYTINQFYERMKWLTRTGTAETLYGLDGDLFRGVTHEIAIDTVSATDFSDVEAVSWAGGTGQMFAIDDVNAGTTMWIQLLTGVAPTDGQTITGGTSSATADVNATVTSRALSFPFVGASTGSALIGSYGFGLIPGDLTAADKLFDLTNAQQTPPNNVQFSVGGLVIGEDYVTVTPESGGVTLETQLSASGTINLAAATVLVQEAIPADTPATGSIRCWNGDTFSRVAYTGWSGSSFTGCTGTPAMTDGDNVFISYIDKLATSTTESFTGVYQSDRSLFIRVRDGGGTPIKTFETTGTLGTGGGSSTAIRTSDA